MYGKNTKIAFVAIFEAHYSACVYLNKMKGKSSSVDFSLNEWRNA